MQFVFQPLTWGFLLVLVPLAVHLINLLRHRRQRWAAMEFLLESYRKHRRWVWLKQLLLLLSRMAIMALVVAMLAQWVSGSRWLALLGETVTHHYILLDDSLSMADTISGQSAYQSALNSIGSILRGAAQDRSSHQVTLIRWSRAAASPASEKPDAAPSSNSAKSTPAGPEPNSVLADVAADILARTIPNDPTSLLESMNATAATTLDVSCEAAIRLIQPLIRNGSSERAIVYLVSDFRKKDWTRPESVRTSLQELRGDNAEVEIQLIDCVESQHENLTLVSIEPEQEVLAAGVPVFVNLQVRNHGSAPVRNVNVRIQTVSYDSTIIDPKPTQAYSGLVQELPSLSIDQIAPGEMVSRRLQVIFQQSGHQVVEAILPEDALHWDNRRSCVLDIRDGQNILLVDGDSRQRHAFYLDAALNPGSVSKTGLLITRQAPDFLRDSEASALSQFSSIILTDIRQLDKRALTHLEEYVSEGGGLSVFFGDDINASDYVAYNEQWYRDGEGLLPVKLAGQSALPPADPNSGPDLIAQPHPIFQSLLGLSNSPFQLVRISRYVSLQPSDGNDPRAEATRVVARLRDGSPLMLDHPFGKGRVIVVLTALDPRWTSWPQDPTFVVAALKMVGYLGSFRQKEVSRYVGTPIAIDYSSREYLPTFEIVLPPVTRTIRLQMNLNATEGNDARLHAEIRADPFHQSEELTRAVLAPGVVEIWGTRLAGARSVENVAQNVSPVEGDLARLSTAELTGGLRPLSVKYRSAESLVSNTFAAGLANRNGFLMLLLIGCLLFEQFLAWSTSYHLPRSALGGRA